MLPAPRKRVNKRQGQDTGAGEDTGTQSPAPRTQHPTLGFRIPLLAIKIFSMRPTEFITALRKGPVGAAYFLRGPDRFLQEECRKAVVNSIPPDSRQWCLTELEFAAGQLPHALEGAEQMPMLGGHNFLLISDPEDFKSAGDEDVEALRAYLERPSPFSTVVFLATEPDRRRRFIQLLEKKAQLVELRSPDRREAASDFHARAFEKMLHPIRGHTAVR